MFIGRNVLAGAAIRVYTFDDMQSTSIIYQ